MFTYESILLKADVIIHTAKGDIKDDKFDSVVIDGIKKTVAKSNAAGNPKKVGFICKHSVRFVRLYVCPAHSTCALALTHLL